MEEIFSLLPKRTKQNTCPSCNNGWIETQYSVRPCPRCNSESVKKVEQYKTELAYRIRMNPEEMLQKDFILDKKMCEKQEEFFKYRNQKGELL
jgi:predicted RNA-binding Zn-ribbon protein involved in translation (DUF1610 family)